MGLFHLVVHSPFGDYVAGQVIRAEDEIAKILGRNAHNVVKTGPIPLEATEAPALVADPPPASPPAPVVAAPTTTAAPAAPTPAAAPKA